MTFLRRVPRRVIQLTCFVGAVVLVWPVVPWAIAPRSFVASESLRCSRIEHRHALHQPRSNSSHSSWPSRVHSRSGGSACTSARPVSCSKTPRTWACASRAGGPSVPPVGRYVAILTLVGAVAGYPVLLWMDPLCIFSSPFAVNKATNPLSVILVCLGLGVLVAGTLVFGMLWCVRICPLSGLQDMLFATRKALWTKIDGECALAEIPRRPPRVLRRRGRRIARRLGAPRRSGAIPQE